VSVKDFWEEAHKNENIHALSGVPAQETWELLGVKEIIKPGMAVLDIGVGLGHNAQALRGAGCDVTCVDISENALLKVRNIASIVHANSLETIPNKFDLAMGLNLIQHISGQEFEKHMSDVIRVLRPDGIYAVETVWHTKGFVNDQETHSEDGQKSGWCWRTPDFVTAVVERNGGKVVKILEHHENKKHMVWWCTLHVSKS